MSEPEGRGAAWTEERGSLRPSDEGRRRLKGAPETSGRHSIVLAVDQGSSSSRCVALDRALRPLALASRPVASSFPQPGWVEHDAGELLGSVLGVVADAIGQAGASWADVAGIGLAAQTETFVVWERESGRPVYPAISWRDSRAAGLCDELRGAGHEAEIRERTGLPLQPAFSAAKLSWLLGSVTWVPPLRFQVSQELTSPNSRSPAAARRRAPGTEPSSQDSLAALNAGCSGSPVRARISAS